MRSRRGIALAFWFATSAITSNALAEPLRLEIAEASVTTDATGRPEVSLKLTDKSVKEWSALTRANVGRKAELRINGEALVAPVIREPLLGRSFQLTNLDFTDEGVRALAQRLSAPGAVVEVEILPK